MDPPGGILQPGEQGDVPLRMQRVIRPELDHETPLPTDDLSKTTVTTQHRPDGDWNRRGPVRFKVESMGELYMVTSLFYLLGRARVLREDGSELDDTDQVAFVCGLAYMLIQAIYVDWNCCKMGSSATESFINFKSYLDYVLSSASDSSSSFLTAMLHYRDVSSKMNLFSAANKGWETRRKRCANSAPFQFICPLNHDFLKTQRWLAPGNALNITLEFATDDFLLCASTPVVPQGAVAVARRRYKLELDDLVLYVPRRQVLESVPRPLYERYPALSTELKRFSLPRGDTWASFAIQQRGKLPKKVVLGFVQSDAVDGSQSLNPLNFHHYNVSEIKFVENGRCRPTLPFTPRFDMGDSGDGVPLVMREYYQLFAANDMLRTDRGLPISISDFCGGYFFMVVDLTADECNMQVRIHIHIEYSVSAAKDA